MFLNSCCPDISILNMNLKNTKDCSNLTSNLPQLYKELIFCWQEVNPPKIKRYNLGSTDIKAQILWGNDNIKFKNKPVFLRNWIKSDIV